MRDIKTFFYFPNGMVIDIRGDPCKKVAPYQTIKIDDSLTMEVRADGSVVIDTVQETDKEVE